ncbi:hypothetical protein ACN4EG_26815 [Alkalinema pantanalense CENA528]|uniref:hypothetical protein n=1 Tax=Alkalinema pantanalense TaxID=1620705 RepID=UPI003D6FBEDF
MSYRALIKRTIGLPTLALVTTVGIIGFAPSTMPAHAQSTDRDRPTLIQSNEIQGTLTRQSDVFFGFDANAGDVKVTIDLKPSTGSIAVASLQFYDDNNNELLPVPLMPTANSRSGDRKTVTLQIPRRQRILMRLTEGTGYGGNYRIKLEGAIDLNQASAGKIVPLPSQGKLRVELKNGIVQEFDLRDIQQAVIKP